MAQHSSLEEMATAAIDEYFQAVAYCLSFRTADGGCLGFPAALLLFCITDALGNWLRDDKVMIDGRSQKIGNCPFRVFNHECFGLQLIRKEISFLEKYYRNRLAHNALIEAGATLAPTDTIPVFDFKSDIEARINVFSFHALVLEACNRFPRERLKDWERQYWINFVKRLRNKESTA